MPSSAAANCSSSSDESIERTQSTFMNSARLGGCHDAGLNADGAYTVHCTHCVDSACPLL